MIFPTQEVLFPWQEPVIRTAQARSSLLFRQTVHSWMAIMQDFGHVTEGMDIVDKICKDAKPTDDNGTIPSDEQPVIEKITITD